MTVRAGAVKVGDAVPAVKVKRMTPEGVRDVDLAALLKVKRAVLVGVPGAFTPTCSARHLPGFLDKHADLARKGVELVCFLSVNDAFVMDAWGTAQGVGDKVVMLADGNGDFTRAMALEVDGTGFGMGTRSKRYAMVVEDGQIRSLDVEAPGRFEVSSVDAVLAKL